MDQPSSSDDFETIRTLGKGSFGVTHLVKRKQDGIEYCMKCVRLDVLTPKEQQNAVNEALFLSRITSPFVIQYHDSFMDSEFLYIIMQFADKGTLDEYLRRKKIEHSLLPESEIWRLFIELAIGVHHIHTSKLIHRDLKTMNVFLSGNNSVKIGDLGVARELGTSSFAKSFVGTPYYLSPELCNNDPYGRKSDVWALGCIVYELATYHKPFESSNQSGLVIAILTKQPTPVNDVTDCGDEEFSGKLKRRYSAELVDMIMLLLVKNPDDRPLISELLSHPHIVSKAKDLHMDLTTLMQLSTDPDTSSLDGSGKSGQGRRGGRYMSRFALTLSTPTTVEKDGETTGREKIYRDTPPAPVSASLPAMPVSTSSLSASNTFNTDMITSTLNYLSPLSLAPSSLSSSSSSSASAPSSSPSSSSNPHQPVRRGQWAVRKGTSPRPPPTNPPTKKTSVSPAVSPAVSVSPGLLSVLPSSSPSSSAPAPSSSPSPSVSNTATAATAVIGGHQEKKKANKNAHTPNTQTQTQTQTQSRPQTQTQRKSQNLTSSIYAGASIRTPPSGYPTSSSSPFPSSSSSSSYSSSSFSSSSSSSLPPSSSSSSSSSLPSSSPSASASRTASTTASTSASVSAVRSKRVDSVYGSESTAGTRTNKSEKKK